MIPLYPLQTEVLSQVLVFLGPLLLFYLIGIPVGYAMGLTVVVAMLSSGSMNYSTFSVQLLQGLNNNSFLAVPFYLMLGRLLNRTGLTSDIFAFADAVIGHIRGGVAYVNIIASMIFAGMSGLASADIAGLGRIEYSAMREREYTKEFSVGVTGASSLIGPILPPSVGMIIYALLADVSIGSLFLAGILPGITIGILLIIFTYGLFRLSNNQPEPEHEFTWGNLWGPFKSSVLALLVPLIVVVGILGGYFTATEAGGVAVGYTILVGFTVGDLTMSSLYDELRNSMVETYSILFIIVIASIYGLVALQYRVPMLLSEFFLGITRDPKLVLVMVCIMFVVIGTFMDTNAALVILVPIIAPTLTQVGVSLVHFGVIVLLTLGLGLLTPPLGLVLFILEQVTDASFIECVKGVTPYYIPILIVILLLIFFPDIVLYVPENFG